MSTVKPVPVQEWTLEDVDVTGSTVTVTLRVSSGIDVEVTPNGSSPSHTGDSAPILESVFSGVPAGTYEVKVTDAVGFEKTVAVTVSAN